MRTSVIRGGTRVDGTGAPGRRRRRRRHRRASSARSAPASTGDRVLDADGQSVTPGFIDIHSHYDAQVFWDPALTPSSFHGVTIGRRRQLRLLDRARAGPSTASCSPARCSTSRTWTSTRSRPASRGTSRPSPSTSTPSSARGTLLNYGVLRRPHRDAHLRDGRGRLRARPHRRRARRRCRRVVARRDGGGRDGLRDQLVGHAQRRRAAGRCRPARRPRRARSAARAAARPRQGRRRVAARREDQARRRATASSARIGRPLTWTALLTVKGFPWHEGIIADNNAARAEGGAGVAADLVPAAHVPDEPARAVHVQHGAGVRGADGRAPEDAHSPRIAIPRGARGRWKNFETKTMIRPNWGASRWPRRGASGDRRPAGRRPRRRARAAPRSTSCSTSRSRRTSRRGSGACSRTTTPTRSRGSSSRTAA